MDWTPDRRQILCQLKDMARDTCVRLTLVNSSSGEVEDLFPLTPNARCTRISPDGKYLAYDALQGDDRQVFIWKLEDRSNTRISPGQHGSRGSDAPVWTSDGGMVLFRSFRLGEYDLWGVPIENGVPTGPSSLIQKDVTKALVILTGAVHTANGPPRTSVPLRQGLITPDTAIRMFTEEFSQPQLAAAWSVSSWKTPNVYGNASFGRYSLTERPGALRFYLDPIMSPAYWQSSLPHFSGWYWVYPSLELNRPLIGDRWVLEARATYSMVDGAQGRTFEMVIYFDPARDRETALVIVRGKEFEVNESRLQMRLLDHGLITASTEDLRAPGDTLGVVRSTYTYRVQRDSLRVRAEVSDDGIHFRPALEGRLRPDLLGLPQALGLTGSSWFVPAGSYVDWEYVRFKALDN
jgi:hypothetical protein